MSEDQNILEQLRKGDRTLLNKIYQEHRGKFIGWAAKQFNASEDMSIEIYQDALVTMYENLHSGKLTTISSSVQSYLFAIGRNKFLELTRYQKKNGHIPEDMVLVESAIEIDPIEKNNKHEQVGAILKEMGSPCKTLLQYFYYEKKSMEDIASLMNYKNMATAKNQKYKCLQRLKKLAFEQIKQHE